MSRGADIAIKHGSGVSGHTGKGRIRLADLINEEGTSVYVKTNATKLMGTPTHVILPHKSSQSGDVSSIEIPMTFVPVDLAMYAPKEELIRNPELMRLLNNGVLDLIPSDTAEAMLDTPEAAVEIDRLRAAAQARLKNVAPAADDPNFRAMHPDTAVPQGSPGQLNQETASVSSSVVNIFENSDYSDDDRYVMLQNLLDILTDDDRRYIRNKTRDERVLKLIG